MRHHNSLYHQLLQFLPWQRFDQLVDHYGADRRVRRLTTKSQFTALLYGQLAGAQSLREIEGALASHANRLYHLGATAPARSTLADANARRPAQLFADLFAILATQATPGLLSFARLVATNLMHLRPLENLSYPPPQINRDPRQNEFNLC